MDDNQQYRELFFEETDEHLQALNVHVLELENEPTNRSILDAIFRSAHTLKGMAATMGYDTMTKLTHRLENVFELFKTDKLEVQTSYITIIFQCLDKLAEIVEELREENTPEESMIKDLLQELEQIENAGQGGGLSTIEEQANPSEFDHYFDYLDESDVSIILQAINREHFAYSIAVQLEESCTLKGPRVYLIMDKLEQQGDVMHTEPGVEDLENGDFDRVFKLLYVTKLTEDKVRELILGNSEIEAILVEPIADEKFNQRPQGGMATATHGVASEEVVVPKKSELEKVSNQPVKAAKTKSEGTPLNQSIRVELGKLDTFMNLVSELVVYRTRLENLSEQYQTVEINEPLAHVARLTTDLQDLVLKIRMQQLNVVMNRFPRMVRDLGNELGKEMELVIEGDDTELDRTVVSELSEPLIHLIRNSADHGIELPEQREAVGKPRMGTIKITAYQEGNRVGITITDDGKGIDPQVIAASAVKKGMEVDQLTNQEILQLIFHPGFSTAEKVTNISGRGVGMDVVRSKITSLGGTIELSSEVNQGTTFSIKLPLTLSIMQSLMVEVGTEIFALPLGVIEKVVKVVASDLVQVHQDEIYMYKEKATPVIRLNESLGIVEKKQADQHLIMVLLGTQYYAILVDGLIGQQEIVIKKLGQELNHIRKYLGATVLGNGEIILILDVSTICHENRGQIDG